MVTPCLAKKGSFGGTHWYPLVPCPTQSTYACSPLALACSCAYVYLLCT